MVKGEKGVEESKKTKSESMNVEKFETKKEQINRFTATLKPITMIRCLGGTFIEKSVLRGT